MNSSSPDNTPSQPIITSKQSERPKPGNLLWFGYFVAAVVWVSCAYSHFSKMINEGDFFVIGNTRDGVQTNDSVLFYAAGEMSRIAFFGKAPLYDSDKFRSRVDALISPVKTQEKVLLQYPPQFFLSLLPLPSFSIAGAWLYSSVISAVCLIVAMRNIVFFKEQSKFTKALLVALAFLWYPSYWCLRLGQNSLTLLSVVSFIWLFLQKKQWLAAGLTTALGVFKVQYLPILAIIGLFQGGKKFGMGLALGALAAGIISLCCYGPANVAAFPQSMLGGEHANSAGPYMMDTFRGLLSIFPGMPENLVSIASVLVLAGAMAAIGFLWHNIYCRLKLTSFPFSFELCGSISMIVLMLTSLHSFIQDYSLLLIAGYWSYKICQSVLVKDPSNKLSKITKAFLLILPAVSWAYGFLPVFCFFLKFMMWSSVTLLVSNLLMVKSVLNLYATEAE